MLLFRGNTFLNIILNSQHSFTSNLIFQLRMNASRKKIMLKRRKINQKKLPVSDKKYKQLKIKKSPTQILHQQQIKQKLQHRPNINQNAYQLVQQLYFPDLRYQNSSQIQKTFDIQSQKQSLQLLQSKQADEKQININWLNSDQNSDLLTIYQAHRTQFSIQLYQQLFRKFYVNCKYLPSIKQKKLKLWESYVKKAKNKGIKQSQLKFNLIFYDENDLEKHSTFKMILNDLINKPFKMNQLNSYVQIYIYLMMIYKSIPRALYSWIIKGMYKSWYLKKQDQLDQSIGGKILRMIKESPISTRYSKKINISNLQEEQQMSKVLVKAIKEYLINIPQKMSLKTYLIFLDGYLFGKKDQSPIFTSNDILNLSNVALKYINQFTLQSSIKILKVYKYIPNISVQFIQLFKFDIFRKLTSSNFLSIPNKSILILLRILPKTKIRIYTDKNIKFIDIQAQQLFYAISEFILKKMNTPNQLLFSGPELYTVLCHFYKQDISVNLKIFYQFLSSFLIKTHKQLTLQELSGALFRLTTLGINAEYLKNEGLQRFSKQYLITLKKYKQQIPLYLPIKQGNGERQNRDQENIKQVGLINSLVLFLWGYLKQCKHDKEIQVDIIFKMFGTIKLKKFHPIIYELSMYINKRLEKFNMFPKLKIQHKNIHIDQKNRHINTNQLNPNDNFQALYQLTNKNSTNIYSTLKWFLYKQAKLSNIFKHNVYTLQQGVFLQQRWSQGQGVISISKYKNWLLSQIGEKQYYFKQGRYEQNFEKELFFVKRQELRLKLRGMKQMTNVSIGVEQKKRQTQYYKIIDEQQDREKDV